MNDKSLLSSTITHMVTNNTMCYIMIKNVKYGDYLCVNNENIFGENNNGTIFKIIPCCDNVGFYLCSTINNTDYYISFNKTNNKFKLVKTRINNDQYTEFYYDGFITFDRLKIYTNINNNEINRYGNTGKYLFMTENKCVFNDGDETSNDSLWKIEKLNEYQKLTDIRSDYNDTNYLMKKERINNFNSIFFQLTKKYNLINVEYNKYLNVSINNQFSINKLHGSEQKNGFILTPLIDDVCVNISHMYNNILMNVMTYPRMSNVVICNVKNNWAKFYIVKDHSCVMFRCIHDEMNNGGKYGRYLCMRKNGNNEYCICSDGNDIDKSSKWYLELSE